MEDQTAPQADEEVELLQWHYHLGHIAFSRLLLFAKLAEIPKYLSKVKPPTSAGCLFGATTKKLWRAKPCKDNSIPIYKAAKPSEFVFIHHMISIAVRLIAQLKGKPTKRRYKAATIFFDHFFRLQYIHLMPSITSKDKVMAKKAFEGFAESHSVHL